MGNQVDFNKHIETALNSTKSATWKPSGFRYPVDHYPDLTYDESEIKALHSWVGVLGAVVTKHPTNVKKVLMGFVSSDLDRIRIAFIEELIIELTLAKVIKWKKSYINRWATSGWVTHRWVGGLKLYTEHSGSCGSFPYFKAYGTDLEINHSRLRRVIESGKMIKFYKDGWV